MPRSSSAAHRGWMHSGHRGRAAPNRQRTVVKHLDSRCCPYHAGHRRAAEPEYRSWLVDPVPSPRRRRTTRRRQVPVHGTAIRCGRARQSALPASTHFLAFHGRHCPPATVERGVLHSHVTLAGFEVAWRSSALSDWPSSRSELSTRCSPHHHFKRSSGEPQGRHGDRMDAMAAFYREQVGVLREALQDDSRGNPAEGWRIGDRRPGRSRLNSGDFPKNEKPRPLGPGFCIVVGCGDRI